MCGELTDGTSDFNSLVLQYLNSVYQGVLAGGNEFGIDVAEAWTWAQAKKPIVLSLLPLEEGSATMTNGSRAGVFSSAPATSFEGRFIKFSSRSDVYRIVQHTAASTAFSIDQAYLDNSGTLQYSALKLDYDLVDDTLVINSSNNKIDFNEGSGALAATLTSGAYSPTSLCAEIKTQMEAAGSETYTVTFNSLTRKFTIAHGGASLSLLFATGSNVAVSASEVLGYDCEDQTSAVTYTSQYALSGILRLARPMSMYKEATSLYQSARDSGKIFYMDGNSFLREYPLSRLTRDVPKNFSLVSQTPGGIWTARMSSSVSEDPIRAEVNYIPIHRKLVDNTASFPVVPGSYAQYLVYGAAHFVMLEKRDAKSEIYKQLAQAKLYAMLNDARKGSVLAGNNFGKLVPRRGQNRIFGWSAGDN
jgi:hypothetical protein